MNEVWIKLRGAENAIALPATARRIHLRDVKAWRVVDTFYEGSP